MWSRGDGGKGAVARAPVKNRQVTMDFIRPDCIPLIVSDDVGYADIGVFIDSAGHVRCRAVRCFRPAGSERHLQPTVRPSGVSDRRRERDELPLAAIRKRRSHGDAHWFEEAATVGSGVGAGSGDVDCRCGCNGSLPTRGRPGRGNRAYLRGEHASRRLRSSGFRREKPAACARRRERALRGDPALDFSRRRNIHSAHRGRLARRGHGHRRRIDRFICGPRSSKSRCV